MASHVTDHHHHNNNESTPPVVILPNYTLVNPNLVPVRYVVNPAAIAQLELNRSVNLQQVVF